MLIAVWKICVVWEETDSVREEKRKGDSASPFCNAGRFSKGKRSQ